MSPSPRRCQGKRICRPWKHPYPIFGSLSAYLSSPLRVVTAALNPSDAEFPAKQSRFDVRLALSGPEELEAELSRYFYHKPYRQWFASFETVLNGLESSYGGQMSQSVLENCALHLDVCSPIATTPTWSKLEPRFRSDLAAKGRWIFEQMIEALQPHLIIASINWSHIGSWSVNFGKGRTWRRLVEYSDARDGTPLRSPLVVHFGEMVLPTAKSVPFANGTGANTPFGKFTTERKRDVGAALRKELMPSPG